MTTIYRIGNTDRAMMIGVIVFGILLTISPIFFRHPNRSDVIGIIAIVLVVCGYLYALLYRKRLRKPS